MCRAWQFKPIEILSDFLCSWLNAPAEPKDIERGTALTRVHGGDALLEVDERGQDIDAVLLGFVVVVDLDEGDAAGVTVVVNVLQLRHHQLGVLLVLLVCRGQRTTW